MLGERRVGAHAFLARRPRAEHALVAAVLAVQRGRVALGTCDAVRLAGRQRVLPVVAPATVLGERRVGARAFLAHRTRAEHALVAAILAVQRGRVAIRADDVARRAGGQRVFPVVAPATVLGDRRVGARLFLAHRTRAEHALVARVPAVQRGRVALVADDVARLARGQRVLPVAALAAMLGDGRVGARLGLAHRGCQCAIQARGRIDEGVAVVAFGLAGPSRLDGATARARLGVLGQHDPTCIWGALRLGQYAKVALGRTGQGVSRVAGGDARFAVL